MMKIVTATVKPHVVQDVMQALSAAGFAGASVSSAHGFGRRPRSRTEIYRGVAYTPLLAPTARVEIVTEPAQARRAATLIASTAFTGTGGDGLIWISDADEVLRIRDLQHNAAALAP